jgi:hypothetical protein
MTESRSLANTCQREVVVAFAGFTDCLQDIVPDDALQQLKLSKLDMHPALQMAHKDVPRPASDAQRGVLIQHVHAAHVKLP